MAFSRDEALKLLRGGPKGVAEWNRRREDGESIPDLSGAKLAEAKLRTVNLRGADLREANLIGAKLFLADLREANLSMADLRGASLLWVTGLTCKQLQEARNWASAHRDPELACGAPLPDEWEEVVLEA